MEITNTAEYTVNVLNWQKFRYWRTYKMNNWLTKVFPATMILLDLMAALMCGFAGDLRKTVYWVAAAVLNAAVTF